MIFFNEITYYDNNYWQSLLENEILVKANLMTLINTLSADPIAKAIKDSIVSNLAGGDNMVDFPKDVKTVDVIDLDPKRKDAFSVQYTKPDGKVITQQIKIGKLVTKLMKKFKPEQIEEFIKYINAFRTDMKSAGVMFEVVKGENIRKYYHEKTYAYAKGKGNLNKSCMRHGSCQDYLDIYVFNPQAVKLLVKFNEQKEVTGRALLWRLDSNELYMDRIYTHDPMDESIFKKWGQENKVDEYYGKWDGIDVRLPKMRKAWEDMEFPYMDTFQYGTLGAHGELILSNEQDMDDFTFTETDGSYTYGGFDADGYNAEGYNREGYNEWGYNEDGLDEYGYDENGYDEDGFDSNDYDESGFDREGYDEDGYNEDGYDESGFDIDGLDKTGRDNDGYNYEGYDGEGYDRDGYDEAGYDVYGYNEEGYDRDDKDVDGNKRNDDE